MFFVDSILYLHIDAIKVNQFGDKEKIQKRIGPSFSALFIQSMMHSTIQRFDVRWCGCAYVCVFRAVEKWEIGEGCKD